jgi:hypothetical protein
MSKNHVMMFGPVSNITIKDVQPAPGLTELVVNAQRAVQAAYEAVNAANACVMQLGTEYGYTAHTKALARDLSAALTGAHHARLCVGHAKVTLTNRRVHEEAPVRAVVAARAAAGV